MRYLEFSVYMVILFCFVICVRLLSVTGLYIIPKELSYFTKKNKIK